MEREFPRTLKDFNRYGEGFLFEHLGMVFTRVEATEVIAHIELQQHHSGGMIIFTLDHCLLWLIHVPVMVVLSRYPNLQQASRRSRQR